MTLLNFNKMHISSSAVMPLIFQDLTGHVTQVVQRFPLLPGVY